VYTHEGAAHRSLNRATGVRSKGGLTLRTSLGAVDANKILVTSGAHKDHNEGSPDGSRGGRRHCRRCRAPQRSSGMDPTLAVWRLGEFELLTRDRVPDDHAQGVVVAPSGVEKDAAMARVVGTYGAGHRRPRWERSEWCRRDESR
jgi:hypothetical protein